jgi:hypothetical protein
MSNWRGLAIDFSKDTGPTLSPNTSTLGDKCTVQNIGVNIGTQQGTDEFDAIRGTNLLKFFAQSGFVSVNAAQHKANFAALDIKTHYNRVKSTEDTALNTVSFKVTPVSIDSLRMGVTLGFGNSDEILTEIVV